MPVPLHPSASDLSHADLAVVLSGVGFTHCLSLPLNSPAPSPVMTSDGPSGIRGGAAFGGLQVAAFPSASTLAASFDVQLLRDVGTEFAKEAKSKGCSLILSPNFNLMRDPRAGRNFEVFGESPLVVGVLGGALVQGVQEQGVGCCVKHLVCNDSEYHRRVYDVQVDDATLREVYTLPFSMAATNEETTPWAVMTAYNKINGVPAAEHTELISLLREEAVGTFATMSDWFSLTGKADTALRAGLDLEMPFPLIRGQNLVKQLDAECSNPTVKSDSVKPLLTYAVESAERLLELHRRCHSQPIASSETLRDTPQLRKTLYEGAISSAVLLKNDGECLPLFKSNLRKIAVVGHHAVEPLYAGHSGFINPLDNSTPLETIRSAVDPSATISFHRGLETSRVLPILSPSTRGISLASPIVLEYFQADGTSHSVVELEKGLFNVFDKPIEGLSPGWTYTLRFEIIPESEDPLFISFASPSPCSVVVDGKDDQPLDYKPPHVSTEEFIFHRYVYDSVFPLGSCEVGKPFSVVFTGQSTPQRRGEPTPNGMQIGFEVGDRSQSDSYIKAAVDSTKDAEVVLVFAGQHKEWESEGFDRADITLPGKQDDLIIALAASARKSDQKLIVINSSSSAVDVSRWIDQVDAFLHIGIAGNEVGQAVADILFGKQTPSGKLGFSWPRRLEDCPSFGNFPCDENDVMRYAEGRFIGYRHFDKAGGPTPMYPFGFGLSYTKFNYGKATLVGQAGQPGTVAVSVPITNSGSTEGREAVQVYLTSPDPCLPVQELKGFAKTTLLAPGQSETVEIELDGVKAFRRWSVAEREWVILPGSYELRVSSCSRDIRDSISIVI